MSLPQDPFMNPALASLLGSLQPPQQAPAAQQLPPAHQYQQQQAQHNVQDMGQGAQAPQGQGQPSGQQQQPQAQPDMNEIMKALAQYQR